MWHRLVSDLGLGVVLAGCGFQSTAAAGGSDGGPGDAAIDGSGSGAGDGSSALPGCFGHWMDGSVAIDASTVAEITELSSLGDDRNPWISDDGLRMFFSRDLGPALANGDIYLAKRMSPAGTFSTPMPFANLNTNGQEGRVTLTPDELALAISTERLSPGQLQIDMQTSDQRDTFASPNTAHLGAVNAVGSQRHDPFLTPDLLRLYLSADTGPGGKLQLLVAARGSATDDFGVPALVPGTQDDSLNKADPTLYQNEQLLVFSSFKMNGAGDLFYATRTGATADFGAPIKLPTVNTGANEFDPMLSADGCELYFASDRDLGGHFHLFHAQVTR